MSEICITVEPTGATRIETHGFTGGTCRAASEFLEQALGRVERETLTSEFYSAQTESTRLREEA
jgi:hypothetical protein